MPVTPKEEILLARCHRGDGDAIQQLSREDGARIHGFLFSCLGARDSEIQELLKFVFQEAFTHYKPFQEAEPLLTRLLRSAVHRLRSDFKHLPPLKPKTFADERLALLFDALSFLDPEERILVLLRDQQDLSHEEMAAVLQMSLEKIHALLAIAKKHFGEMIHKIVLSMEKNS